MQQLIFQYNLKKDKLFSLSFFFYCLAGYNIYIRLNAVNVFSNTIFKVNLHTTQQYNYK